MVAFNSKMVVFIAMVVSMAVCSSAMQHIVGGAFGWDIPENPNFYAHWASSQIFTVGDTLVFKYPVTDVKEVSKDDYDHCAAGDTGIPFKRGPAIFKLTSPGHHYYVSLLEGHCEFGQKLAVNVDRENAVASSLGF